MTASLTLIARKEQGAVALASRRAGARRSSSPPRRRGCRLPSARRPARRSRRSGRAAARMTRYSSESADSGAGTKPARSNSRPLCTSSVASPPSSRIMVGPSWPGQRSSCSVHHQYSSSVSPFQAKTGTPRGVVERARSGPTTTAAAAWSWVEKMLQLTQRTSAPRATSVSIRPPSGSSCAATRRCAIAVEGLGARRTRRAWP